MEKFEEKKKQFKKLYIVSTYSKGKHNVVYDWKFGAGGPNIGAILA